MTLTEACKRFRMQPGTAVRLLNGCANRRYDGATPDILMSMAVPPEDALILYIASWLQRRREQMGEGELVLTINHILQKSNPPDWPITLVNSTFLCVQAHGPGMVLNIATGRVHADGEFLDGTIIDRCWLYPREVYKQIVNSAAAQGSADAIDLRATSGQNSGHDAGVVAEAIGNPG